MNWKNKRDYLNEIGMLDEVRGLLRDCLIYINDIKHVGKKEQFIEMYKFIFKKQYWLKEGIGFDVVEDMLGILFYPPFNGISKDCKVNKLLEIEIKIRLAWEDLEEKNDSIYH